MRFFVSLTFLGLGGVLLHGCGSTNSSCNDLLTCTGGGTSVDASTGGGAGQSGTGGGTGNTGGHAGSGAGGRAAGGASAGGAAGANAGGASTGGATGAAGVSGAGGADAGGGSDGAPKCDETQSPAAEACLVSDQYAVFVSKGAAIGGIGTKESPVSTISQAMMQVRAGGPKRIILCNATYTENVTIQSTDGELSIYGGFACPAASGDAGTNWTPTPGVHAVVAPAAGVPLTIKGTMAKIVVGGIDFVAADAPAATAGQPTPSSIGGIVAGSTDVTLVDVAITAGKGADGMAGAPGAAGANGADPTMQLPDNLTLTVAGNAVCSPTPPSMPPLGAAWSMASSCGSKGGGGGDPAYNAQGEDGRNGTPQTDVISPNTKNGGSAGANQNDPGTIGSLGSDGVSGGNGQAAATFGTFSADGYSPADGNDGTDGHPGQGGGGGGASFGANGCTGAGGGVGGMGGCGGTHGLAGKGGGASVGLVSWDSGVVLDGVQLVSMSGGAGGKGGKGGGGGLGGPGTSGGLGDSTHNIGAGGYGQSGGKGGYAGSGSGGTGGPSYALVFHGTKPTELHLPTPKFGSGGMKGAGGDAVVVNTPAAPDGADGNATDRYAVTP